MHKIIYYTRTLLWYNRVYNRIVHEHYTLPPGEKRRSWRRCVCVSFLFSLFRWSFDRHVDDGVVGGLSDSVKEKS